MKNKINVGVLIGLVFGIHFLASAMGVPPIEKTSPAQTAFGTVLDGNGQPIQNAFVMLAENPYRCALTGADGAFSVDLSGVTNAETLRVSAAGMVPVSVALPTLGKLKIQMNAQDAELSKIEVGCNQATFRDRWSCADNRPLTPEQQICVEAYREFIASESANAVRTKILTQTPLTEAEQPYRYIVLADMAVMAKNAGRLKTDLAKQCKAYCAKLRPHNQWVVAGHQTGKTPAGELLERAYRGKPLTEDDVQMLREMIVIESFLGAGRKRMPPSLLWRMYEENHGIGTPMGEVRLVKLESALKQPKYSDFSDLNATTFLRPEALCHYLQIFNHWQEDGEGNVVPKSPAEFPAYPGYSDDDFVTNADWLGKPTIIFNTSPLEDMTHPPAIAAFIEYLRRAYGDQINVVYIANVSTYHGDMWEDEFLYYGRNPAARPLAGIDSPALQHETTLETLARITKLMQMKNPSYSWDIVLDDVGHVSSLFQVSGGERRDLLLFDKEGTRVCWKASVGVPEETGANGQNVSSYHTPFYGYYILEKNLRKLLANDGLYDLEQMDYTMPDVPPRAIIPGRVFRKATRAPDYPGKNHAAPWSGFCLNVLSVNPDTSEITVETGQFSGSHQMENLNDTFQMTFVADADTRIIIKEKKEPFDGRHYPEWIDRYKHGTLKDIVPGDLLRVDFQLDNPPHIEDQALRDLTENYLADGPTKPVEYRAAFPLFQPIHYSQKTNRALRIWNTHTGAGETKVHQQIVFWGEITKVDPESQTIEVRMPQPDGDEIHGYRFWKEAGEAAHLAEDTKPNRYRTAEKLAATRRYVEGTDADRIRTFHIDDGVRISRNGIPEKSLSDFQVGDKVSVFYLPFYESQYRNSIPIYPEVILSCSPLN